MYFKFLNNNENVLFNQQIINACQRFYYDYLESFNNHELVNRQHNVSGLGTFYLVDFEYCSVESCFYGTVNFLYETMTIPKIVIRFKDERIMSVVVTHT
jgi:hypothetical protein